VFRSGSVAAEAGSDGQIVLQAPNVIGEVAFVHGSPRSATVTGTTDGQLLRLRWESFEAIRRKDHHLVTDLALALGRIIASRLTNANQG